MTNRSIRPASADAVLLAAAEILEQGIALLEVISEKQYTTAVEPAFDSTMGAHYRHCLDHFTGFLAGTAESHINYDHRPRDPMLECDLFAAANLSRQIKGALGRLTTAGLAKDVSVRSKVLYHGAFAQDVQSTFARELMYVVAHAMHHYALIRVMANLQGVLLPDNFGVAPSTVNHAEQLATGRARGQAS
jgi:hypothetical protein